LLVAVESGRDAETLIQWTGGLARSLNAPWIVLYVETSRSAPLEEESRLTRNLDLARAMGAEVVTTVDEDMADAILRVALSRNTTQIVVGKSVRPGWLPFSGDPLLARLLRRSGDIAVQLVPVHRGLPAKPVRRSLDAPGWLQYMLAVGTVVVVALAGFLFTPQVGAHAMAFLSLLAVVVLALFVRRGPALLAAAISAGIWDYFFLPPVFDFRVSHFDDALLLGMYFVVALALGQLTARIRAQEAGERQRERHATALYLLTRQLAEAATMDQIVEMVVEAMERAFDAKVAVLLAGEDGQWPFQPAGAVALGEKDREAAAWVLRHLQTAGKFTANVPLADSMFVPLVSTSGPLGVMGLRLRQSAPMSVHQKNLLDTLSRQIALSLDRQRLREISGKAKLLAESERLSKMLLDSMSHEIRTPLSAIENATSSLVELGHGQGSGAEMIAEIREATDRLNRLVGKVLDITRIETGRVEPSFSECDVGEVIQFALAGTERELARHQVSVQLAGNLPMLRLDFVFLQEALMNLLSNAAHHTPPGTLVEVRVWTAASTLFLVVADRGPGIAVEVLPRIFDKFYRGPAAPTGGTGLGLSLVKGFVEALGGTVTAVNRSGGGAEFTIRLPVSPDIS
jgi:two-component system sensor histidine kinase KdpD